jgi:hypothetical protein
MDSEASAALMLLRIQVVTGLKPMKPFPKKCANITCLCNVTGDDEYCGKACRARGRENVEIACHCDHLACPCVVAVASAIGGLSDEEKRL